MKQLIAFLSFGLAACAAPALLTTSPSSTVLAPPVYRIEELAWPDIDALDRAKTLVILPVGMLGQHGPHLPGLVSHGQQSTFRAWLAQRRQRPAPRRRALRDHARAPNSDSD